MVGFIVYVLVFQGKKDLNIVLNTDRTYEKYLSPFKTRSDKFKVGKHQWAIQKEYSYIDNKGRILNFYTPKSGHNLKIDVKGVVGELDSKLSMRMINDEHIANLTKQKSEAETLQLLLITIFSILGGLAAILTFLKTFGVLDTIQP